MPTALEPPTLSTGNLVLRPWELDDASALRDACGDEDICRFTTVPRSYSPQAAREWIERQHAHAIRGTAVVLAIVPGDQRQPVGMIGLFGLDQADRSARFGYWLIARARGRGLISSAARELGGWAFATLGLEAIFIDREPANAASARVAERLGAAHAGSRMVRLDGLALELVRHRMTP